MKAIVKQNRELLLINAQNTQNENKAETIILPAILLQKGTNVISIGTELQPSDMYIKYKGKE